MGQRQANEKKAGNRQKEWQYREDIFSLNMVQVPNKFYLLCNIDVNLLW
jgi:hypothetical protein